MNEYETIETLTQAIDSAVTPDASLFYRRGRLFWQQGLKGEAMSDYGRAAAIDPQSPAVEALKLCNSIMDFYNTDLYNP
ncbi:MAG: tetratricopeptide repeat protein [Odoribacter sp.]|nr:tetratricopeptide repeat protein [Odoribacter sp.]